MTSKPPLALRSDQTDWETEMWARALVALAVGDEPPPVPLLVTDDDWQALQQAADDILQTSDGNDTTKGTTP